MKEQNSPQSSNKETASRPPSSVAPPATTTDGSSIGSNKPPKKTNPSGSSHQFQPPQQQQQQQQFGPLLINPSAGGNSSTKTTTTAPTNIINHLQQASAGKAVKTTGSSSGSGLYGRTWSESSSGATSTEIGGGQEPSPSLSSSSATSSSLIHQLTPASALSAVTTSSASSYPADDGPIVISSCESLECRRNNSSKKISLSSKQQQQQASSAPTTNATIATNPSSTTRTTTSQDASTKTTEERSRRRDRQRQIGSEQQQQQQQAELSESHRPPKPKFSVGGEEDFEYVAPPPSDADAAEEELATTPAAAEEIPKQSEQQLLLLSQSATNTNTTTTTASSSNKSTAASSSSVSSSSCLSSSSCKNDDDDEDDNDEEGNDDEDGSLGLSTTANNIITQEGVFDFMPFHNTDIHHHQNLPLSLDEMSQCHLQQQQEQQQQQQQQHGGGGDASSCTVTDDGTNGTNGCDGSSQGCCGGTLTTGGSRCSAEEESHGGGGDGGGGGCCSSSKGGDIEEDVEHDVEDTEGGDHDAGAEKESKGDGQAMPVFRFGADEEEDDDDDDDDDECPPIVIKPKSSSTIPAAHQPHPSVEKKDDADGDDDEFGPPVSFAIGRQNSSHSAVSSSTSSSHHHHQHHPHHPHQYHPLHHYHQHHHQQNQHHPLHHHHNIEQQHHPSSSSSSSHHQPPTHLQLHHQHGSGGNIVQSWDPKSVPRKTSILRVDDITLAADDDESQFQRVDSSQFMQDFLQTEVQRQKPKFKVVGKYLMGAKLGEGSFGKVKECVDSNTMERLAAKIMKPALLRKKKADAEVRIEREVALVKRLKHPNVVRMVEVFRRQDKDKLYLIMEFCVGSLQEMMHKAEHGRMSEGQSHGYFRQLAAGLSYIHSQRIVHCDIKPGNLLLSDDETLKISDFGEAVLLEDESSDICKIAQGTPQFCAPEVATGYTQIRGFPVDIWAAGVCLYHMLSGSYPFVGDSLIELFENISSQPLHLPIMVPVDDEHSSSHNKTTAAAGSPKSPQPPAFDSALMAEFGVGVYKGETMSLEFPSELNDVLRGLLHKDPDQRMSLAEVAGTPWFQKIFSTSTTPSSTMAGTPNNASTKNSGASSQSTSPTRDPPAASAAATTTTLPSGPKAGAKISRVPLIERKMTASYATYKATLISDGHSLSAITNTQAASPAGDNPFRVPSLLQRTTSPPKPDSGTECGLSSHDEQTTDDGEDDFVQPSVGGLCFSIRRSPSPPSGSISNQATLTKASPPRRKLSFPRFFDLRASTSSASTNTAVGIEQKLSSASAAGGGPSGAGDSGGSGPQGVGVQADPSSTISADSGVKHRHHGRSRNPSGASITNNFREAVSRRVAAIRNSFTGGGSSNSNSSMSTRRTKSECQIKDNLAAGSSPSTTKQQSKFRQKIRQQKRAMTAEEEDFGSRGSIEEDVSTVSTMEKTSSSSMGGGGLFIRRGSGGLNSGQMGGGGRAGPGSVVNQPRSVSAGAGGTADRLYGVVHEEGVDCTSTTNDSSPTTTPRSVINNKKGRRRAKTTIGSSGDSCGAGGDTKKDCSIM